MSSPRIVASLAEISDAYDAVLCDVWGVLHDGKHAFPEAAAALAAYRARGGAVALITNAPRPNAPVCAQLDRLGVTRDAYDAVVTSGDATLALIQARGAAPALHIGPERDLSLFAEAEARSGVHVPRVGPEEASYVICTGLDNDETETPESYRSRLAPLAARKLPFLCANPDLIIHRGADLVYCAGALGQLYETLGGEVTYAGKPYRPIYETALAACAEALGRRPTRVLAIGDGFRTDVFGARDAGLDVLFIAAGIHRDEALRDGEVDAAGLAALFAREGFAPAATLARLR